MKRQSLALAAIAVGLASAAPAAHAQDTGILPVRVKVGVFLPQSTTARDLSGSTHYDLEADVALPHLGSGKTYITAGYSQGSNSTGKLRVIPLTLTYLFAPPNPAKSLTGNVYFGGGVGPYFIRSNVGGASQSKTTIGGFGVVGYQFPNPYFIEAKYSLAGKVGGISPSGLALLVGRSF